MAPHDQTVDMPTTTIRTIRTVAVPVRDQDASISFFVDRLGFELRMDAELTEGFRWAEVAPPDAPVSVAIVAASDELPAGIDTGIRFVATDAAAEHASMTEQGVDVGELLRWPDVPLMFEFKDPDGNVFYLAEPAV
jgi:catechol 2,3-dioxygenase-like lactoylglutathione lyase family enzyme